MLSHDQQYIVDVGAQLSLRCEFFKAHFNLFDNPVQWKKSQYGEETELNILGNVREPFDSTGRFKVTYNPDPPRYTMELTIRSKFINMWYTSLYYHHGGGGGYEVGSNWPTKLTHLVI